MEEPDGISTIEIGWDLDLVLLADGEKMGPAIFRMEGADEDSGARQKLQGFQGGRDSCAGGVGARSAMAGWRCSRTGAVDRGDEKNRGKK